MTYPPRRTELKINEGRMQRRADDQMRAGETPEQKPRAHRHTP